MRCISIVTPCRNEAQNIRDVCGQVKQVFNDLPNYSYEHILIDNASSDNTPAILKELAKSDKRIKVILNTRNFGQVRSPFHAILQASGDAVITIVADLQDPPYLIKDFIKKWEEGYKVVLGIKKQSEEPVLLFWLRALYYRVLRWLSDVELVEQYTGFGLYDRLVVDTLCEFQDAYPYFRGIIAEMGFESARIEYLQPARKKGRTNNNFYTLFDLALLGMTSYSKVPLRLVTMTGFVMGAGSLLIALGYFIYKLLFWTSFSVGQAPLVIGLFLFASVQLFSLGIVGEYIGSIHSQVLRRPLVVEKERINF